MTTARMPLGPVMLDVAGVRLTSDEHDRLLHPLTGGVILFARNYESPEQLSALVAAIRALREPRLLVAVDQEGGRVQRFRTGFTSIPAMGSLGRRYDRDPDLALRAARAAGALIGAELAACGVDFSFTPVLDLDYGASGVIGDRAFHRDPRVVSALAGELMRGLHGCGMAAVGKHFPGHGYAAEDSHLAFPVDPRSLEEIAQRDLLPYAALIPQGLQGVMPAHVVYPAVDPAPAGFSRRWLQEVLRGRLGFAGTIFSDDLSMEAATAAGGIVTRAEAALQAGCDMVLVCNRPEFADDLLGGLRRPIAPGWDARVASLYGRSRPGSVAALARDAGWQRARADLGLA